MRDVILTGCIKGNPPNVLAIDGRGAAHSYEFRAAERGTGHRPRDLEGGRGGPKKP